MTIEQEIKLQVEARTNERAKELAKDIAKNMAQDIAKDMAQDIAQSKVDESKLETAKKMLENNIPAEIVAKCTGLEISQVDKLKK